MKLNFRKEKMKQPKEILKKQIMDGGVRLGHMFCIPIKWSKILEHKLRLEILKQF